MPPKTKKKRAKAKAIDFPGEAKLAYHYYLNACKLHKCLPNDRVSTAFGRVMSEVGATLSEAEPKDGKKKKAKKKAGPKGAEVFTIVEEGMRPRSLRAIADVLIEYPRAKNLCFWGTAAPVGRPPTGAPAAERAAAMRERERTVDGNDAILQVVCSVLDHKKRFRWSKASSPLHVEIVGRSARQLAEEPPAPTPEPEPAAGRARPMYDGFGDAGRSRTGHDASDTGDRRPEGDGRDANDQACFSVEKLSSLASSLAHSSTLVQVLILNNSTLGDEGFAALFRGLYGTTAARPQRIAAAPDATRPR